MHRKQSTPQQQVLGYVPTRRVVQNGSHATSEGSNNKCVQHVVQQTVRHGQTTNIRLRVHSHVTYTTQRSGHADRSSDRIILCRATRQWPSRRTTTV